MCLGMNLNTCTVSLFGVAQLEALLSVVCICVTPVECREAEPPRGRFPGGEIVQVFINRPEKHDLVGWAKRSVPNNQRLATGQW